MFYIIIIILYLILCCRVFVPEFSSKLNVFIQSCSLQNLPVGACELSVILGSASLGQSSVIRANCSGPGPCSASLSNPPWNSWVRVSVEISRDNVTMMTYSISANFTGVCMYLHQDELTRAWPSPPHIQGFIIQLY